ncbi:MAG: hypothetical protein U0165_09205 [Polyangiaceae bacterium]
MENFPMFSKSSVSSLVLAFLVSGFAQGCGGGDSASSASEPGQGGSGAGAASGAAGSSANAGAAGGTGNTGGAGSSSGAGASGNSGTAGDGGAGSSNGSSGNSGSAGNAGSAGGGGTAGNSGNGGSAGDGSTGGVGGAGASAGSSGGAGSAGMQQAPECQYAVPEPAPGAACQDVANYHAHVEHCSGGTPEQVSQKIRIVLGRLPKAQCDACRGRVYRCHEWQSSSNRTACRLRTNDPCWIFEPNLEQRCQDCDRKEKSFLDGRVAPRG